jgi:hypothetical protein
MIRRTEAEAGDFAAVTSGEMHAWRTKLLCISRHLQDELGARMHRHGVPLGRNAGEDQTAFDWITGTCVDTFGASAASLWTVGSSGDDLEAQSTAGKGLTLPRHRKPRADAPLRRILASGTPVIRASADGEAAEMVVPIVLGARTIGLVRVAPRSSGEAYTEEDLETLRFMVEVAAVCCHLSLQDQRIRQAIDELDVVAMIGADSALVGEDPEELPRAA